MKNSICGDAPDFQLYFLQDALTRSLNDEDAVVYHKLFHSNGTGGMKGTFVEMGAFDGITNSNSHFFEVCKYQQSMVAHQILLPNHLTHASHSH